MHPPRCRGGGWRRQARGWRFHPTPDLTTLDVEEVLATVEPVIARRLRRLGCGPDADAPVAATTAARQRTFGEPPQ